MDQFMKLNNSLFQWVNFKLFKCLIIFYAGMGLR